MRQMEISKWLKGITILVGVMGLLFFALLLPELAMEARSIYPEISFLFWPALLYFLVIAIGCYTVLFLFWGVCTEIGKDNSFSEETAGAFVKISRIALAMAIYWFIGLVILAFGGWLNSGIIIFLIGAVLISIAIAILSAALSHLILKAYEIKKESDFTI